MANTVTRLLSNGVFQSSGMFDEVSLNSGSLNFSANGDLLTYTSNASYALPGPFTFEAWIYPRTFTADAAGGSTIALTNITNGFQIGRSGNGTSFWGIASTAVAWDLTSPTYPTTNTWSHIAITRNSSNVMSLFLNGTRLSTATVIKSYVQGPLLISRTDQGTGTSDHFNGYISNLRLIKGSTVYDPTLTTLTVPTSPLLPITNTVILLSADPQSPYVDSSINNFVATKSGNTTFNTLGPFYYPGNTSINLANTNNNPIIGSNTNIISSTTNKGIVMTSGGFDEVNINGGSIRQRTSNSGTMLIGGYFDEVSGIL